MAHFDPKTKNIKKKIFPKKSFRSTLRLHVIVTSFNNHLGQLYDFMLL